MKNSDNKVNKEKQVSREGVGEEKDRGKIEGGGGRDKGKKKRWERMRGGVAEEKEKEDK